MGHWDNNGKWVSGPMEVVGAAISAGNTASRPTNAAAGTEYFDTEIGKPIWYDGTGWVDATGTSA